VAELYPSTEEYEQLYAESAEETVDAGFALEDDREALDAYSEPARVAG
jgi:hypothetical protein